MKFLVHNKHKISRRKAISQIVGSLFMLAIVVPIGVVILSQGLFEVTDFSRLLTVARDQDINSVQEDIIFEHVRFDPNGNQVTLHLRNISNVESSIDRITIVKIDNQELLLFNNDLNDFLPLKDTTKVPVSATLQFTGEWKDPNYQDFDYKISVTTTRGNFFDTVARPFNT